MNSPQTVSLFIPCLVDQVYPEMGLAMARVLKRLGYSLEYNPEQTCCGQPAFNAGHREESRRVAAHFLEVFKNQETIVCPSGSCPAMVRNYYAVLFKGTREKEAARHVAERVREFSEFLTREEAVQRISGTFSGRVGFHNSCHSYRELRLTGEALEILKRISGYELVELEGEPVCCGFGGVFSVKFEAIAATMARTRLETFLEKRVETLVSNDPGCILHLRQEANARGHDIEILHLAEFLEKAMELA